MKRKAQDYYFTKGSSPTEQEKAEAKRLGATMVNGLYGNVFKRPVINAYGNVPDHLKDKQKDTEEKKVSPEIKSDFPSPPPTPPEIM